MEKVKIIKFNLFLGLSVRGRRRLNYEDDEESSEENLEHIREGLDIERGSKVVISKDILTEPIDLSSFKKKRIPTIQIPSSTHLMAGQHHFVFSGSPKYDYYMQKDNPNYMSNYNQIFPRYSTKNYDGGFNFNDSSTPQININITTNINQTPHYNAVDDPRFYYDYAPQRSPMNIRPMPLAQNSSKAAGTFSVDFSGLYEGNNNSMYKPNNIFNTPMNLNNSSMNNQMGLFPLTPSSSRDINMRNKVIIAEEVKSTKNQMEENEGENFHENMFGHKGKKPEIDVGLVNQSETNAIFMQSLDPLNRSQLSNLGSSGIRYNNDIDLSPISAFTPRGFNPNNK
ncbi:MAG: hypothetical protein MJ252_25250 [archaeon]|nr:hypothetical protein [archaeon]